jgi:hypothetical protein
VSGRPFVHFWIQVKSGSSIVRVNKAGTWASAYFDADHLRYWSRQPVPVFGALVPDPLRQHANHDVYFCDISTDIMERHSPNGRRIRSFLKLGRDDTAALQELLDVRVVASTARWQCHMHGVIRPLPTPTPEYFRKYPSMPVVEYQKEISEQIRTTAAFTIIESYRQGRLGDLDARSRRILGQIVAMQDANHWENPFAAGLSLHQDGRFSEAARLYEAARLCILSDPRAAGQRQWRENADRLAELAKRAASGTEL